VLEHLLNAQLATFMSSQILVESQGGTWSEAASEARHFKAPKAAASKSTASMRASQTYSDFGSAGGSSESFQIVHSLTSM